MEQELNLVNFKIDAEVDEVTENGTVTKSVQVEFIGKGKMKITEQLDMKDN